MTRLSTELARAALKTAVKRLLAGVGGQEAAASITRVAQSKLSQYGSPQMPDRNVPVDVLLDLEIGFGAPVVTTELARLQGFTLLPVELGEGDVAAALSEVARDCGKTLSDALRALADELVPEETEILSRDLAELAAAVNAAFGILARKRAGAGEAALKIAGTG